MKRRMRCSAAVLVCAFLVVPAGSAQEITVVRADWEEARSLVTAGNVRPPIHVVLQSGKRLKGKLGEVTETGLTLKRGGPDPVLSHSDIQQIRITHRTTRRKNRWLFGISGLAGGSAVAALLFRSSHWAPYLLGLGAVYVTPVVFYKVGAGVDRGAIVIELVADGAASAGPDSSGTQ